MSDAGGAKDATAIERDAWLFAIADLERNAETGIPIAHRTERHAALERIASLAARRARTELATSILVAVNRVLSS